MQRQDQYQEFVKKLKKAQQDNSSDQLLKQLSEKADYMLFYIKEHMPSQKYIRLIWLFMIPFLILTIISFWTYGSLWRLLPVLAALIFIGFSRQRVIKLTKENPFERLRDDESLDRFRYIEGKVDYVKSGIQVKRQRIMQVMFIYTFFFPFYLYMGTELLWNAVPLKNLWLGIFVAYLVGSYIWKFVFDEDLDELDYYEASLNGDLTIIRQSA